MAAPQVVVSHAGFADVNSTRLFYEILGAGPPLTLIHGFSLDTRMWDEQFAALGQRHRVLRYDARGFGRSAVPGIARYSHTEDLRALLAYLEIKHTALIGFSLGGGIAISYALADPAAVDALIVAGCLLPGRRLSTELSTSFGAIWSAGRALGVAVARERWLQHPLFAFGPDRCFQLQQAGTGLALQHQRPGSAPGCGLPIDAAGGEGAHHSRAARDHGLHYEQHWRRDRLR